MESLSDIVAQMRGRGEDGRVDRHLWNEYADRIEAAAKRVVVSKTETVTVGNAAAMREALVWMSERMNAALHEGCLDCDEALGKIDAALSAPARQCDVGTAEEQGERCLAQFNEWRRKSNGKKVITAIMEWAQTPYAEEGAGK